VPCGAEVSLGPGYTVLDGDPAPLFPKRGTAAPNFGPCLLWPNGSMDQDATWYRCRPRPRPHCVRWGISSRRKSHSSLPILVHVYCGQTAGWIRIPHFTEVGLGPGDVVLDGTQLSSSALATAWIAPKICQGQPPRVYSRVLQISSNSVHFRSYSRRRQHHQNRA